MRSEHKGSKTMNVSPRFPVRSAILTLGCALFLIFQVSGCSNEPRKAGAVDAVRARDALKTTLDAWKGGSKPAELKQKSPAIVAQDLDWEKGLRLVDYSLNSEGTDDTANLRIPVELVLADPSGQESRKKVTYVVGTSPSITVFRELFQ
jgi:hypothetical protein